MSALKHCQILIALAWITSPQSAWGDTGLTPTCSGFEAIGRSQNLKTVARNPNAEVTESEIAASGRLLEGPHDLSQLGYGVDGDFVYLVVRPNRVMVAPKFENLETCLAGQKCINSHRSLAAKYRELAGLPPDAELDVIGAGEFKITPDRRVRQISDFSGTYPAAFPENLNASQALLREHGLAIEENTTAVRTFSNVEQQKAMAGKHVKTEIELAKLRSIKTDPDLLRAWRLSRRVQVLAARLVPNGVNGEADTMKILRFAMSHPAKVHDDIALGDAVLFLSDIQKESPAYAMMKLGYNHATTPTPDRTKGLQRIEKTIRALSWLLGEMKSAR